MRLTIDKSIKEIPYYPKAALYGGDSGWVRLSSNENPNGPSPKAVESIVESVFALNRYPESEYELKSALAGKYALKPENIIIGNGSNEIIETSFRALRYEGKDEALLPAPSFAFYPIAAKIYGYRPKIVPLRDLKIEPEAMADEIGERTRIVILNNPNNPTGTIFEDAQFRRFLERLPDEILVVVDEAYAEFVDSPAFPRSTDYIADHPVLILRTFSKAYGLAGLRVGYGIAGQEIVSYLERTKQPFSVNMMALVAAKAALTDERYLKTVLEGNRSGKSYLYRALTEMGVPFYPSEANFFLIKVGPGADDVTKRLFEAKVLVRSMSAYDLPDFIRVTVGTADENRAFIEALRRSLP
ncbi:MAG TPA: histidinol-phosphate transaminase [Deltaproteobacteria bacterium]|nr:histidinol-phosphate transaminase [Deltaproteobacteria bacterium]